MKMLLPLANWRYNALVLLLAPFLCCFADVALAEDQQKPLKSSNSGKDSLIFNQKFDDLVAKVLKATHVPGLSIGVYLDGETYTKGYGIATFPDDNVTADTLFFTGSTTKVFTSTAMAQLIQNKSLGIKWTDPVNKYLPEDFVLENEYATTHTTIEDALSHRSGLPRHDLSYGQPGDTLMPILRRLRYLPLTYEPRTAYQYCNLMFAAVTGLIEKVTGKALGTVLQENIWKPLGMNSTTFDIATAEASKRLARGYFFIPDGGIDDDGDATGEYIPELYLDILPISGAGATISNVKDYVLWMEALIKASHLDLPTPPPITKDVLKDLVTPRTITGMNEHTGASFMTPATYALGLVNKRLSSEVLFGHNGGLTGFGTEMYMLPDQNFGVVTMGNTMQTSNDAGAYLLSIMFARKLRGEFDSLNTADHLDKSQHDDAMFETILNQILSMSTTTLPSSKSHLDSQSILTLHRRLHNPPSPSPKTTAAAALPLALRTVSPPLSTETIPLPIDISLLTGTYSHPGYGTLNLTTISSSSRSNTKPAPILRALISPDVWTSKIELTHVSDTVFTGFASRAHGMGNDFEADVSATSPSSSPAAISSCSRPPSYNDTSIVCWQQDPTPFKAFFSLTPGAANTVEKLGIQLEEAMVNSVYDSQGEKSWKESMLWFDKVV